MVPVRPLDPPDGEQLEMIRKRKFPLVGDGGGVWSLVHVADAASATVAAVEHGEPGIYNVVDDEPAPVSEFVPYVAKVIGAKPPRRVPKWLARLLAGEAGVVMMTEIRGASNAKAKRELGWQLRYPSWRQGFAAELGWTCSPSATSRSCARGRSRSPTGCSAASARPRTSSRRRCCACTAPRSGARRSPRRAPGWRRW